MHGLCLILVLSGTKEPAPDDRLIAGRPLAEWQSLIHRIELRDPSSRRFVPGLVAIMDDERVPWVTRRQAALTLGRLGPLAREAIPKVANHLTETCPDDPEMSPQRWALSALSIYGREAKEVAPQLVTLLKDKQSSLITRLGCLEALSQIGSAAPEAIAALWDQLEIALNGDRSEANDELAVEAAQALGMVGPDAAPAVPVLMRAAQAENDNLRREAVRALGRMGISARDAQPLLCDLMASDESELVRDVAMSSLGQTGPTAWPLVAPLLAVEDAPTRERAVTAISGWGSLSQAVLPAVNSLLSDPEPRVRLAAAKSWRSLTQRHDRVWPILIELLVNADRHVRRGASQELQAIVKSRTVTDEELQFLDRDERPAVQKEAVRLRRLWVSADRNENQSP
jgi:HEAT repeat protein